MTTPITTIPELEALPWGSIVLDRDGDAWQRGEDGWTCTDRAGNTVDQPSSSLLIFAPLAVLWPLPAPVSLIDREAIDVAIGGVLFSASNYPGPAQVHLWGRDIGPLRRKVTDAVLAIPPGKTEAQVRAEAWDEGYHDGQRQGGEGDDGPRYVNPYLADEEAGK